MIIPAPWNTENCYADFAAEVRDFAETDPALDRATALCLKATDEAVHDAGLSGLGGDPRVSVIMVAVSAAAEAWSPITAAENSRRM